MAEPEIRIHPRQVQTGLRRADLSDTFVVGKYACSPYMACAHGCAYCDGRAERYWVQGEFDQDIVVRRNLPELLERELPRLRERGCVTLGSGISDVYQPVEATEGLTRRCLEALAPHGMPVTLLTKSALVLRDLDVVGAIAARSRFLFIVSLVHVQDTTREAFEPRAASVPERLAALRRMKAAGCATGVLAMPLLPGITDDATSLERLYSMVAACGVDFIQPGGLTLRPGRQKDTFLQRLRAVRPDLEPLYGELYAEERASGAPRSAYQADLLARCRAANQRTGIPFLVPHRLYQGQLMLYDETAVLLHHMAELYAAAGRDTHRLQGATRRYLRWLTGRKREYNRRRSWDYENLSRELTAPGAVEEIVANERLAAFLRRLWSEGATFDYVTLQPVSPADPVPAPDAAGPQPTSHAPSCASG